MSAAVNETSPNRVARAARSFRRAGATPIVAGAFLFILAALALLLPVLPLDPTHQELMTRKLSAPFTGMQGDFAYLLGGDELGRSVLARLIDGARISIAIGGFSALIAMAIGTPLGILAAIYRGRFEDIVMRLADLWMSFPALLLSLVILYTIGSGVVNLILILAFLRWMVFARVARALTLSVKENQFYEAARAIGTSNLRIIRLHILPNVGSAILMLAILEAAKAMLTEAALSFLGLGIQPPQSSWGTMLAGARVYMSSAPWLVLMPGLAIVATVLSVNLLVRALQRGDRTSLKWRVAR